MGAVLDRADVLAPREDRLAGTIIGSLAGMSLPFLLNRFRVDPAIASATLVTILSHAVGVLLYFSIASIVLPY